MMTMLRNHTWFTGGLRYNTVDMYRQTANGILFTGLFQFLFSDKFV